MLVYAHLRFSPCSICLDRRNPRFTVVRTDCGSISISQRTSQETKKNVLVLNPYNQHKKRFGMTSVKAC